MFQKLVVQRGLNLRATFTLNAFGDAMIIPPPCHCPVKRSSDCHMMVVVSFFNKEDGRLMQTSKFCFFPQQNAVVEGVLWRT